MVGPPGGLLAKEKNKYFMSAIKECNLICLKFEVDKNNSKYLFSFIYMEVQVFQKWREAMN